MVIGERLDLHRRQVLGIRDVVNVNHAAACHVPRVERTLQRSPSVRRVDREREDTKKGAQESLLSVFAVTEGTTSQLSRIDRQMNTSPLVSNARPGVSLKLS